MASFVEGCLLLLVFTVAINTLHQIFFFSNNFK